mmetsp:Transcript_10824/g.18956  ORF Transcript_10824/g.18956 Transcript_10824/m.18956 type:complete len:233 (+) Transcript_10824:87-785(+)
MDPFLEKIDITSVEENIRSGFVRKVYSLLSVQLVLTGVIAFPIQQMDKETIMENRQYLQLAMILSLVSVLSVTCCCQGLARQVPWNYFFLFLVTVCEAVIVGFISALYTTTSVLMAVALTSIIFIGLTMYAMTTETDFTGMGGYLMAFLLGMIGVSFLMMFFPATPLTQKLMAGAGAVLFSCYIVFDTQLICGGKHEVSFGIDDYVFAALTIYLDIINLFLYLLQLFGDRRD